ncbi:MAG: sensor histidine kinase [bacterium]
MWFFYSQFLLLRLSLLWRNYAATLLTQLEKETQVRTNIYAKFMSRVTEPGETGSPELDIIFDEVIQKIDFPVVICNPNGVPIAHRNLNGYDTSQKGLTKVVEMLNREHEPIPVQVREGDSLRLLNVIYYGVSPSTATLRKISINLANSVRDMRLFSLVQLILFFGFMLIGIWGLLTYKKQKEEHIWTALAKETAHQLATPISSFSAWLEMLKENGPKNIVLEMEEDLARMKEVLSRFSRIGLPPELELRRLGDLIRHSVEFVQRRSPQLVHFRVLVEEDPAVKVDEVLFSWTVENLLKNSVDAIGAREGEIEVRLARASDRRFVEISVSDTGEGVKVAKLFDPGVTSKPYGWGVGLTLAKRIVESYHRGRLILKESHPKHTVFAIYLPIEKEKQ